MHNNIDRRRILAGIAASAALVPAIADTAMAANSTNVEEPAMNMIAHKPLPAVPVELSTEYIDELVAVFNGLSPMKRVFLDQQIRDWLLGDTEYFNIFHENLTKEEVLEAYEEWLSGFDQSVIDAFESGRWPAPALGGSRPTRRAVSTSRAAAA